MRPLPEAAGKVLELGRRVPRMQPQDLQQVPRGRGNRGVEVHGLLRLQVSHILGLTGDETATLNDCTSS